MKEIPAEIRVLYDALLVQKEIPQRFRFYYKKWLRYYLDFWQKYNFKQSDKRQAGYSDIVFSAAWTWHITTTFNNMGQE